MQKFVVATRGSKLALVQTASVVAELRMKLRDIVSSEELLPEFVIMTHRAIGDKRRNDWQEAKKCFDINTRSRKWTLELEQQVAERGADLAVHSGKDLPFNVFEGTDYIPVFEREDERDVLIFEGLQQQIPTLPSGFCIGTNSPRRRANLSALNPQLKFVEYSGNVTTRIKAETMRAKGVGAVVMAAAGLKRLGLYDERKMQPLDIQECLPAGNQGILAVQVNANGDALLRQAIEQLVHLPTLFAWHAERAFLERFGATCETPISVHAQVKSDDASVHSAILRCRIPNLDDGSHLQLEIPRVVCQSTHDKITDAARQLGIELGEMAFRSGVTPPK